MDIPLVRVCDSATTICVKSIVTYMLPAANVLASDVFGTDIFH